MSLEVRVTWFLFAAGCTGPVYDSVPDGTDTDTDQTHTCDATNEDCTLTSCSGDGDDMLPGADCLLCHSPGSGAEDAPPWSAAGTLFSDIWGTSGVSGATVRITDSTDHTVTVTTSTSGNFHTAEPLVPPLVAEVETDEGVKTMGSPVATGSCNSCHACGGAAHGKMYQ